MTLRYASCPAICGVVPPQATIPNRRGWVAP